MPTYTWNDTFEASPADTDEVKYGAQKIRELKKAISERLELEMNFKAGSKPLVKAGVASVCYTGTANEIANISEPSDGAIAWDTENDALKRYDASANAWETLFSLSSQLIHVQEQGTQGGSSNGKSGKRRALNTVVYNNLTGASLNEANNTVVLPQGNFYAEAAGAAYRVKAHRVKIINITDANTVVALGTIAWSPNDANASQTYSYASGRFSANANDEIAVVHYCEESGPANEALGVAGGDPETGGNAAYAELKIWRL